MSRKEIAKRYILFIISLFISAMGVAMSKQSQLGVSPISSVSNILSMKFTALSLGTWLIIWNCILIVGQIILLRRKFQPIQLLQVPLSFLFGWFTDISALIISPIPMSNYPVRLTMLLLGTVVLGFGIALSVIANVIMNSGEALVKAISDISGKQFGNVKICFDISCVTIAIILSLLFFNFSIREIREGTLIAAVATGMIVKLFTKLVRKPAEKILTD